MNVFSRCRVLTRRSVQTAGISKQNGMEVGALFSTSVNELVVTTIDDSGIATLTMNKPPVNTMSLEMLQAISDSIQLAQGLSTKGIILASSSPSAFSAGLDIKELFQPEPERLKDFWTAFQQVYLDLYGCPLPCIAAMEGHAVAAGCMLALSCDVRIITSRDATIGLNESKLGIVAPPWLANQLVATIGNREAEKSLALGLLYQPDEALRIGLVDDVVLHSQVLNKAKEEVSKWMDIPAQAMFESKLCTRQPFLDQLRANREADCDKFCSFVKQESIQDTIEAYIENLNKKKD